jgi:hypothetical protein
VVRLTNRVGTARAQTAHLAGQQGVDESILPERVREILAGRSFVAACPGCRTISHVVGHQPPDVAQ